MAGGSAKPQAAMCRAFVAVRVKPTPALRDLMNDLSAVGWPVRTTPAGNLHITLRFLGGTLASVLPDVVNAVRQACAGVEPFDLKLNGLGVFPSARRPRVMWVGTSDDAPLCRIVDRLEPEIEALGFGGDGRPWSSHLTIARIKARPPQVVFDWLDSKADAAFGAVRVGRVDVMLSELSAEGPRYSLHESVTLVGCE